MDDGVDELRHGVLARVRISSVDAELPRYVVRRPCSVNEMAGPVYARRLDGEGVRIRSLLLDMVTAYRGSVRIVDCQHDWVQT